MQMVRPMAGPHMPQVPLLPSCSPALLPTLWCRSSFLVFHVLWLALCAQSNRAVHATFFQDTNNFKY